MLIFTWKVNSWVGSISPLLAFLSASSRFFCNSSSRVAIFFLLILENDSKKTVKHFPSNFQNISSFKKIDFRIQMWFLYIQIRALFENIYKIRNKHNVKRLEFYKDFKSWCCPYCPLNFFNFIIVLISSMIEFL